MLPQYFVIALPNQVSEAPVSKLATFGAERLPNPHPSMEAIDVKGTIASIRTGLPPTWPEHRAGRQMPAIWVKVVFCFHDVTLPQEPPNQWINSFAVRAAYTRAAALGDTMMVV